MRSWSLQQSAVFAFVGSGKGHGVVKARPGTGKTTVIVEAVRHVPAGKSVLCIAFNKAIEVKLTSLVPSFVTCATLHSFGLRAQRGVTVDKNKVFKILDNVLGVDRSTNDLKNVICKVVSLSKANLASTRDEIDNVIDDYSLDVGEDEDRMKVIDLVISTLETCKRMTRSVDFDDMIWLPVVNKMTVKRFDQVFVDETQDLNRAQLSLAQMACAPGGRILAVGDDLQSINGFAGADSRAIPRIIETLNATVLPLTTTYRCGKAIVRLARDVAPDFEAHESNHEGQVDSSLSYEQILESAKPGDFVLSRTNAPLVSACLSLIAEDRKAMIAGRDIGASLVVMIRKSKATDIPGFLTWLDKWEARECERLEMKRPPRDTAVTVDKAKSLRVLCAGKETIAEVIARIESLFNDSDEANKVVFSTTHKAKGLERKRVFMFGWTYLRGRMNRETGEYAPPSQEEKNIWFVAATRAQEYLGICNKQPGK